jgi:hypothetical protein
MLIKNALPLCLLVLITACDSGSSTPTIDRSLANQPEAEQPDPVVPPASTPANIVLSETDILGLDGITPLQTSGSYPMQGMWIFTEKRVPYDNSGLLLSREVVYIDEQAAKLYRCGNSDGVDFATDGGTLTSSDESFDFIVNDDKNELSASFPGNETDNPFTAELKAVKVSNNSDSWSDFVQLTVNSFSSDEQTLSATDFMATCYIYSYLETIDEDGNKSETALISLVSDTDESTNMFEFSTQIYTTPDGSDDAEQYGLTVEFQDINSSVVAYFLDEELTGSPSFDVDNNSFTGSISGINTTQTIDLTLSINLNP